MILFLFGYTVLTGSVLDAQTSQPLYLVDVYVKELKIGTATDEHGRFSLTLPAGEYTIMFSRIGYEEVSKRVNGKEELIEIVIRLTEMPIEITGAIVATSSYSFSEQTEKHDSFSFLDVYNDPGGAGEVYWSIKSLPGTGSTGDMAPIYPRGGSPKENITLLDKTSIHHPFHQENVGGGLFSIFDPVIFRQVDIYLGGFPARYSNSLSSIVDIKTKYKSPERLMGSFGLNNVSFNTAIEYPISKDFFLISSYRRNFTNFLFKDESFEIYPYWQDFTGKLIYNLSDIGDRIEFLCILAGDEFEIGIDGHNYREVEKRSIFGINWFNFLSENMLSWCNLSYCYFSPMYSIPELFEYNTKENMIQIKEDLTYQINEDNTIEAGFSIKNLQLNFYGLFPEDSAQWQDTTVKRIECDDTVATWQFGTYYQQELKILQRMAFNLGLRADYLNIIERLTFDPRFSFCYAFGKDIFFHFATGIYHQFAELENYLYQVGSDDSNGVYAKPGPLEAIHYVVGIEKKFGAGTMKLEGYYKDYRHLLLQFRDSLNNQGYGYSKGIEFFAKVSKIGLFSGWCGYGYCDSKRREGDLVSVTDSEYDIPHNFNVTASCDLPYEFNLGFKFRYATGRPYTPIVDVEYDSTMQRFSPIYGDQLSARYPSYQRLDVRLQKKALIWELGTIFYLEVTNLLDRKNPVYYVFDYQTGEVNPFILNSRTLILGLVAIF